MTKQAGFSFIEMILAALAVMLVVAIIIANYRDAVIEERRALAQQALMTSAGLQERWFVRLYEYAGSIEKVGGADAAGEYYDLRVTQDPCGDTSCFTVTAIAKGEQQQDSLCERMSINYQGKRRAVNRHNEETTHRCWGQSSS